MELSEPGLCVAQDTPFSPTVTTWQDVQSARPSVLPKVSGQVPRGV